MTVLNFVEHPVSVSVPKCIIAIDIDIDIAIAIELPR